MYWGLIQWWKKVLGQHKNWYNYGKKELFELKFFEQPGAGAESIQQNKYPIPKAIRIKLIIEYL
jgi:hypothetical protein